MRVLCWNCCGSFKDKDKEKAILSLKPDIAIIPESDSFKIIKSDNYHLKAKQHLWFPRGENNKALSVLIYGNYKMEEYDYFRKEFKIIVPLSITGNAVFDLYAVYANNPEDKVNDPYIGQVLKAIDCYKEKLNNHCMLIGDFNSNKVFDIKYHNTDHAQLIELLSKKHIYSCYHSYFKEVPGKETMPTWYRYRKETEPYHIDYCFASEAFIKRIKSITIGKYKDWIHLSDHMPIVFVFSDQPS
jgi:exodeoxyribonuclease-3